MSINFESTQLSAVKAEEFTTFVNDYDVHFPNTTMPQNVVVANAATYDYGTFLIGH